MKSYRFITLSLLILLILIMDSPRMHAQNVDSLELVFQNGKLSNPELVQVCDELSWYYLSGDFSKAKYYANQGIDLAKKTGDKVMEGTLYRNLGVTYYMVSIFDSAGMQFDKALDIALSAKDQKLEALVYGAYANMYNVSGAYEKALDYYFKALGGFEKTGNRPRIGSVLGNIAVLYCSMQKFDEAEKYLHKAEQLNLELNNLYGLMQTYQTFGNVYAGRNHFKPAMEYSQKAAAIARQIGDKSAEALCYQVIAETWAEFYQNHDSARVCALRGLVLAREAGFPGDIAAMLSTLANIEFFSGNFEECRNRVMEAIRTDTSDLNIYGNLVSTKMLSEIHLGLKEEAQKSFNQYKGLIIDKMSGDTQAALSEMEVKYETEKKESRIVAMERERKQTLLIGILSIIVLLMVVVVLIFRHRTLAQKKRMAEQQIIHLEREKQLVATQAVLEGETTERTRLARDLHDGLGGMLSVVKLKLMNMKGNLILPEMEVPAFQNAIELLDNSIGELRRVARNLMPESLMRYGLKAALTDFCGGISQVELHYFGEERRLEEKVEIALFRIVQELVNNAIKHSEAERIHVQLIVENNRVNVVVQDNGKGFDLSKIDTTKTTGMTSIRSRVESLNGKMDLFSAPGQGTEVQIDFLW